MRVMYLDAWFSMVVFTVATVSFYTLGATVLHRQGLVPEKSQMIETLSTMYVPAFGAWTKVVFLIGVWAVLFKTLYVASASNSRLTADFFGLAKMVKYTCDADRDRWIRRCCVAYPAIGLMFYLWWRDPKGMVILGGFVQAATLPIISAATIYPALPAHRSAHRTVEAMGRVLVVRPGDDRGRSGVCRAVLGDLRFLAGRVELVPRRPRSRYYGSPSLSRTGEREELGTDRGASAASTRRLRNASPLT